jgi:muramoyltetrapeptide carboxypeptidase
MESGNANGRLWGGNLAMVAATIGTRFEVPSDGILFLEEVSEPRYRIDRMFAQLALAGFFGNIHGLILGDFSDLSGKAHSAAWLKEIVRHYLGRGKIPVLTGLRAGHKHTDVLLAIGGTSHIEAGGKRLALPVLAQKGAE